MKPASEVTALSNSRLFEVIHSVIESVCVVLKKPKSNVALVAKESTNLFSYRAMVNEQMFFRVSPFAFPSLVGFADRANATLSGENLAKLVGGYSIMEPEPTIPNLFLSGLPPNTAAPLVPLGRPVRLNALSVFRIIFFGSFSALLRVKLSLKLFLAQNVFPVSPIPKPQLFLF